MSKQVRGRPFRVGRHSSADGFSLVELVIALAVISVTFIGIIGLLGLGLVNDENSSQQTGATNIADSIIADMRSTPSYSTSGKSPRFGITIPTTATTSPTPLASGTTGLVTSVLYFDSGSNFIQLGGALPGNAAYGAHVYAVEISPFSDSSRASYLVRVVVLWPAAATTAPAGNLDVISQYRTH
jgi:prepilin-type N-terminal cleavage/methylation domain-containing protein